MSEKGSKGEVNAGVPGAENVPTVARLCYVDDSRTAAYVVRRLLQPLGYQIDHFASAEPAFLALVQEDYDLLLTDLKVSSTGMDGDDLIRTLRQSGHPRISAMPIIVITGANDAEVLVSVYEAGANQVMKKPVDGDELDGHIRRLLVDKRRIEPSSAQAQTSEIMPEEQHRHSTDATVVPLHTAQRPSHEAEPPVLSQPGPRPPVDRVEVPVLSVAVPPAATTPAKTPPTVEMPVSSSDESAAADIPPEPESLQDSSIVRAMQGGRVAPVEPRHSDAEERDQVFIVEPADVESQTEMPVDEEVVIIEPDTPASRSVYGAAQHHRDYALLREIEQYPLVATQYGGRSFGLIDRLRSLAERLGPRRLLRSLGVIIALFVLLAGANAYFGQGRPVDTVLVESGEIFQSIRLPGRVVSKQWVNVSPVRAGRVMQIQVKEGDQVLQGQVLARMDDQELLSRLKRAQADLSAARDDISLAQRTLARLRKAHAKGAVARRFVEDAEGDLRTARSQAGIVVEEVRSATLDVDTQKIVAAFAGTITARYAEVGQWVEPTETLLTLVDESQREIELRVDAAQSAAIDVGQAVAISSDAFPGQEWQGSVVRLGAEAGNSRNANSVQVYISLGKDAPALRYGQLVDAAIRTAWNPNTLKIPLDAVISRDGQTMVAVLEDGKVRLKMVEVGIEGAATAEIKQGLNAGERVILSKGKLLQNGDRVYSKRDTQ